MKTDVLIVGGGMTGLSFASIKGTSVVLCLLRYAPNYCSGSKIGGTY